MNNKSKKQQQQKQKQVILVKQKTSKKKRSNRNRNAVAMMNSTPLSQYVNLVSNPCRAKIVPGLYGSYSGYPARFHTQFTIPGIKTGAVNPTFGYVIWFPSYHNNQNTSLTSSAPVSFVVWCNSVSTAFPTAADYGKGNVLTTASSVADPAYSFVNSDVCSDARTLSACLKVTYTGSTSGGRGIVYPLTNIPLDAVLEGGTSGVNFPPSTAQMCQYSDRFYRGTDSYEVLWRPSLEAVYRSQSEGVINPSATSGGSTGFSAVAKHNPPLGIGFAFFNVSDLSDYLIDAYKIIEWRAEPSSGLTQQQPVGVDNPTLLSRVMTTLDTTYPNWQSHIASTAMSALSSGIQNMSLFGSSGVTRTSRLRISEL